MQNKDEGGVFDESQAFNTPHFLKLVIALGLVLVYSSIRNMTIHPEQPAGRASFNETLLELGEAGQFIPLTGASKEPLSTVVSSAALDQSLEDENLLHTFATIQQTQVAPPETHGAQPAYTPIMKIRRPVKRPVSTAYTLPEAPLHLVIPAIELDAPIVPVEPQQLKLRTQEIEQWLAPDSYAAGWHESSARLGETGNTVLNGHHNAYGEVFRYLVDLNVGDLILVYSAENIYTYQVSNKMILPEKYETLEKRMENAQWMMPSEDERLTLITCWPYENNTHRLILAARPLSKVPRASGPR